MVCGLCEYCNLYTSGNIIHYAENGDTALSPLELYVLSVCRLYYIFIICTIQPIIQLFDKSDTGIIYYKSHETSPDHVIASVYVGRFSHSCQDA